MFTGGRRPQSHYLSAGHAVMLHRGESTLDLRSESLVGLECLKDSVLKHAPAICQLYREHNESPFLERPFPPNLKTDT